MKKYIIILSLIIAAAGCSPDTFMLNLNTEAPLWGEILSGYGTVEQKSANSILITSGGAAAIRCFTLTQFESEFTVKLQKGKGIRFEIRNVPHNRAANKSIKFDYTASGCKIAESGAQELSIDSVTAIHDTPALIKIKNDGKYVKVSVDCADIYFSATNLLSTEWIILEALEKSEILVYGIKYSELAEDSKLE